MSVDVAALAQLVEQRTENPCVPSSILGGGTDDLLKETWAGFLLYKEENTLVVNPRCFPLIVLFVS